ncbi:hypothetical protein BD310DRAFT_866409 [Dichomitus squalens]|uniref:LIM zinc-binding domain-containing protein n=1 Tax=Dichomitus squalens TaxID=114155 RepID=A0A4Q9QDV1_9APHY|nr:hypothetical protein BD310DRAFT_866409 [Dichomitus squalens]
MGFCRRCGDIVVGPRCKCGGSSVAPVVKWNQSDGKSQDPWSKTYVTRDKPRDKSPTKPVPRTFTGQHQPDSNINTAATPSPSSASPTKRFPRPTNQKPLTVSLDRRVSEHIATSTSVQRPPSPLKHSTTLPYDDNIASEVNPEEGILPNLNSGSRLAKVYGSVLQPKETLSSFICALCSAPFPPDATIYPDPTSIRPGLPIDDVGSGTRFLCRPCFTANGGSKGDCPACGKPVLILKSEGGFVEASGKVWHKRCFCCEGCFKNISDHPMVDLLGRPSCADCFDTCLKRTPGNTPRKPRGDEPFEERSNLGGTKRTSRSREGSPALEELELRLGIRSRDSTPVKTESRGAKFINPASPSMHTPTSPPSTQSPVSKRYTTTIEPSPISERLAARARAQSSSSAGSPALRDALTRYQSSDASDGSPVSRRTYNRLRSPEPDGDEGSPISSRSTGTGSPRYGSPVARQPTADAVEEMKQRFLRQASPGISSSPSRVALPPSETTTPTRRDRERRSRSRPRSGGAMSSVFDDDVSSSLGATQPLRVRRDNTGGTEAVRRDRTGETEYVRRDRTGDADYVRRDTTGTSSDARRHTTGDTDYTLKGDRTGDAEVESLLGSFPKVPTGDLIDLSSDTSVSSIDPQLTGNGPVSRIPRLSRDLASPPRERVGLGISMGLRKSISGTSLATDYTSSSMPLTPDLASDVSDTMTQSSGPSTPPSLSPPYKRAHAKGGVTSHHPGERDTPTMSEATTPTPKSRTLLPHDISIPAPLPPDARCARCSQPLFSRKDGGKFVTVPEQPSSSGVPPKTYHTSCFRCTVCDGLFEEKDHGGRAIFVRGPKGACHVECAPPERTIVRSYPVQVPRPALGSQSQATHSLPKTPSTVTAAATYHTSSSRYEAPPPKTAPPTQQSFVFPPQPRFGSANACPGCHQNVSPMERGVVPGPQGSRWHAACLICGGQEARGRRKAEGRPGCGKKLDSAAKTDRDGGVWCRECLLILPLDRRGSPSPTRSTPVAPAPTGSRGPFGVAPQYTGTTTLARQFTGIGSSDTSLMRQLTGGGLSPTRQLTSSPTKMHDGPRPGVSRYPRPKSAIGFAARTKSEGGEGRGMYLVRQLTGGKNKEAP